MNISQDKKNMFKGLALGLFLAVTGSVLADWNEPPSAPTGGNVSTPINVSNIGQTKGGNLVVNGNNQFANGLIVPYGALVIGDSTPEAGLKVDVEGKTGSTMFCDENGNNCFTASKLCQKVGGLNCQ